MIFVGAIYVVTQYVRHSMEVSVFVLALSSVVLLAAVLVSLIFKLRGVMDGRSVAAAILSSVALAGGGVAVAIWVIYAPMNNRRDIALDAIAEHGALGVLPYFNEVALQLLGVLAGTYGLSLALATVAGGMFSAMAAVKDGFSRKIWLCGCFLFGWAANTRSVLLAIASMVLGGILVSGLGASALSVLARMLGNLIRGFLA